MSARSEVMSRMSWRDIGLVAATYCAAFIALLDVFVVVLALPTMQSDLGASTTELLWVVGSFSLCMATFALSAGALGDRYGRRRVFMSGVALFTVGSAICATAPVPAVLIAGRLVAGLGAAVLVPATLALLALAFPEPRLRAKLFGGWASVTGTAAVIGPVVGGALVGAFGWPSIFLVNLPLGVIVLVLARQCMAESADAAHAGMDWPGQLFSVLGLGTLTYGLINVGTQGWTAPSTVIALVIAVVGLSVFGALQWRREHPMLPLRLFADRAFAVASVAAATIGLTAFTLMVFVPSYLQEAEHHSVALAGVMLLPWPVTQVVASYAAGWWCGRSGARSPMALGMTLIAVASLGLVTIDTGAPYPLLALVLAAFGAGVGLTFTPSNTAAMGAVQPERSSTAAAIVEAVRQTGTLLGIALLGLLFYRADLTNGLHHAAIATSVMAGACAALVLCTPALSRTHDAAH